MAVFLGKMIVGIQGAPVSDKATWTPRDSSWKTIVLLVMKRFFNQSSMSDLEQGDIGDMGGISDIGDFYTERVEDHRYGQATKDNQTDTHTHICTCIYIYIDMNSLSLSLYIYIYTRTYV